jgi:S-adenosylmethionine hydrolase
MALRYDTISFLSDYGLVDEFVGVVHSVVRSIAPEAHVIDLTHQIAPYDVRCWRRPSPCAAGPPGWWS